MYSVSFNPIIFDNAYPSLVFSNLSVKRSSSFIGLLKLLGYIHELDRLIKFFTFCSLDAEIKFKLIKVFSNKNEY